jgi:hypothetical protein
MLNIHFGEENEEGHLQSLQSLIGNVIVGIFLIIFYIKIYVNDIFYFFKIIFDISISKRSKT